MMGMAEKYGAGHVVIEVGGKLTELRQAPDEADEQFMQRAKLVLRAPGRSREAVYRRRVVNISSATCSIAASSSGPGSSTCGTSAISFSSSSSSCRRSAGATTA